ncbi:hypothetical protein CR513_00563, partial [Mucuna pruriens]
MVSSSIDVENLSPKSRMMMKYMKNLEGKIEKLGGGLELMRIGTQNVSARIRTLSRGKEKEVQKSRRESENSHYGGYGSYHSKSSRSQRNEKVRKHDRYRDEPKRNPMGLIKEQNLECIDCDDMIRIKPITLSFEGYALIWWNVIVIQIRGMRKAPIESWDELKREMRKRFVPSFYNRDLFVKLQRIYQGTKSVKEYFKKMEVTLIRA